MGLLDLIADKAKSQYAKGAPYREALSGLLQGNMNQVNAGLSKSDLTPMDFALMMGINPIGVAFPPVNIDETLLNTIIKDKLNSSSDISHAINSDVVGVVVGSPRMFDRQMAYGKITEDQLAKDFAKTKDLLKSRHGENMTLYRAEAPQSEWHPDTKTVYMATKDEASKYAHGTDRKVIPYKVNIDDILGANANDNGYFEFIVKKQNK